GCTSLCVRASKGDRVSDALVFCGELCRAMARAVARRCMASNGEAERPHAAPDQSRGRTMSSRAHGDTTELHGPLQRLLDVAQALFLCLAMSSRTVGTSSAGTSITVEAESAASSSATASSSVCDS